MFHPLYTTQAYQLLRGTCTYCHHFLAPKVQVIKYQAKLRLLEHGLIIQSMEVDQWQLRTAKAAVPDGDASQAKDATLEDRDVGHATSGKKDDDDETTEQFAARLGKWVGLLLDAHKGLTRDEYKNSGNVYDRRRKTISEFLKSLVKKRCEHCGAYAHRIRKEGHTKIVEYSLVKKQKDMHRASGIKRRNAQLLQQMAHRAVNGIDAHTNGNGNVVSHADADGDLDSEDNVSVSDAEEAMSVDGESASDDEDPVEGEVGSSKRGKQTERIIPPTEVRAHLRLLFANERAIVDLLYSPHGPLASSAHASTSSAPFSTRASADIFFTEVVSVPPSRFRPAATMGDQVFENPQNALLNGILRQTFVVRDLNVAYHAALNGTEVEGDKPKVDKTRLYVQLLESLINLQVAVNSMMDSTKNPMPVRQGKLPPTGVKQLLEKKEGLFRKNMMGKRVNYAARSVISPDVNIETNEIGVPPVFARKLTFPEPVTAHNVNQMRQLVINGPNVHPGACFIQMEDGHLISLDRMDLEERTAQANKLLAPESSRAAGRLDRPDVGLPATRTPQLNRKVYRHLSDGDIVILNRQPTLHKPSMMCHRVRVLKGDKVIRMHYANCNSYNADFDGDEMNMHFPQSLNAQAEARMIANTDNQYLTPTSGNPLRGLIQDHVVAAVWLTNKDTFFTRSEYQQLIYGSLRPENDYTGGGMVLTVPPAIYKPEPLWTGKQVISTLMKNITPEKASGINFSCKAKVPGSAWGVHTVEETVLFVDGDLLTGVIDKAQIGASAYGLVHSVFELYGPEVAGKLLSILSRILTKYLQSRAFTCRMDDLLLTPQGNAQRRELLQKVNDAGLTAALDYVGLADADRKKQETADDLRARLEEILRDDYKLAGLDATVEGETNQVTTGVIKTCLPHGLVKPFPHNNMQTMTVSGAKGSNVNASQISCLLGQQSLEGRRVPTMVSGKTLPSFKPFETAPRAGGFVAGRFLTGIRPQEFYFHCMAGREGLIDTAVKTSRSGYLQRCLIKHLEGLKVHYDNTVRNSDQSVLQFNYGEDSLDVTRQKHLMQIEFAIKNTNSIVQRLNPEAMLDRVIDDGAVDWKKALKHPDQHAPPLSYRNPSKYLGTVSERYAAAVEKYIADNPHRLLKTKKAARKDWPEHALKGKELMSLEHFRSLMYMRYMRSLVDPGEAVGLMASQGVGEPSTQMTLNTFHFAGHGAANVTLGIPRLREIVMTASQNIRTPTMQLPIIPSVEQDVVNKFCQKNSRLTLSEIVDEVTVEEQLSAKTEATNHSRQKLYKLRLAFFPEADVLAEHSITPENILTGIARTFVPLLDKAILKEIKQNEKENKNQVAGVGKASRESKKNGAAGDDGEEEDAQPVARDAGEDFDNDADDLRRARQGGDEKEYEDEDESEGEGDVDGADDGEAELEKAFASANKDDDSDSDSDAGSVHSDDSEGVRVRSRAESAERMKQLCRQVAGASKYVDRIRFDAEHGEWAEFDLEFSSMAHKLLLVGIVEGVARQAVVQEVAGISRIFVAKAANTNAAKDRVAVAEGINLQAVWQFGHGIVDMNQVYTNDVGAILRTYGVEAARTSIIKEMSGVFSVYGIGVDYRHLTIIADYMTCEGGYKPFNRTGLSNNSSPFLKASFETTANFVAEAALFGDYDDLGAPSSKIVLGQVVSGGTGAFGIRSVVEA